MRTRNSLSCFLLHFVFACWAFQPFGTCAFSEADDVFMRKKYKFGAEARAAGGYGLWQLSYGSTGAG